MNRKNRTDRFICIPIADTIFQIQVTHFSFRRANAYLLVGDPLTLVDTGHSQTSAFNNLEAGLTSLGYRISDIESIIYTHPHIDHCGGGLILNERTSVQNVGLLSAKNCLENQTWFNQELVKAAIHFFETRSLGVPPDLFEKTKDFFTDYLHCGEGRGIMLTNAVEEGSVVKAGGVDLQVLHTPSHTPWDMSLYEPRSGLLFTGDFLLEKVASLLSSITHSSFDSYLSSLARIKKLKLTTVLPGHGHPIKQPSQLVRQWEKELARREKKITTMVKQGKGSVNEISCSLLKGGFDNFDNFDMWFRYLGFVDTYLTKLVQEGKAEQVWEEGKVYYRWKEE